jgi:hypothetical protein
MKENAKRKNNSEKILVELGSEYLPSFPTIELERETKIRSIDEIYKRIICLISVAAAADGVDRVKIRNWLKDECISESLTNDESTFLNNLDTNAKDKIKYSWKSECAYLLLWSVNKVNNYIPIEQCSIDEILSVIPDFGKDTKPFLKSLVIRSKKEILDLSDLLYRAHWATRQNQIDGKTQIGKLNADVVAERHYAVNWLTNYDNIENWDDITTDT